MSRAALCVAAATALGVAAAGAAVLGDGDLHFRLDAAHFRGTNGKVELELYVEIDNHELEFHKRGDAFEGRARLHFEFLAGGKQVGEWEDDARFEAATEFTALAEGLTQIVQLRLPVAAGTDSVRAMVQDLNATKKGLFHLFAKSRKKGQAAMTLSPRQFPPGQMSVSDLQFARAIRRSDEASPFFKSGLEVEPQSGRVYGRFLDRVSAYYEVYDLRPPAATGRRRYSIEYLVVDPAGADVRRWSKVLSSSGAAWADTVAFDVAAMPAGSYQLRVQVADQGSDARAVIERAFEVFWESADWVSWIGEQDDLTLFYLDGDQLATYESLGAGARQRYLEDFWARTEGRDGNPVRDEFLRRVEYADRRFTSNVLKGRFSDMGRVYIRFGEPDEIRREVITISGSDLNTALDELDRESGGSGLSGTRNIDPRDDRSFEVWLYNYRGHELFDQSGDLASGGFGMKFIFVDDLGMDVNFRLIRSTERVDF